MYFRDIVVYTHSRSGQVDTESYGAEEEDVSDRYER